MRSSFRESDRSNSGVLVFFQAAEILRNNPPPSASSGWVRRSRTTATMKNASPPEPAKAMSWLAIARYSNLPKPPAPMIAAIPSIEMARSSVWLIPVIRAALARGNCTSVRTRRSDAPYARAASTTSSGTCRMPKLVNRISGGRAKTMVTIVAETNPTPKKNTNGSM